MKMTFRGFYQSKMPAPGIFDYEDGTGRYLVATIHPIGDPFLAAGGIYKYACGLRIQVSDAHGLPIYTADYDVKSILYLWLYGDIAEATKVAVYFLDLPSERFLAFREFLFAMEKDGNWPPYASWMAPGTCDFLMPPITPPVEISPPPEEPEIPQCPPDMVWNESEKRCVFRPKRVLPPQPVPPVTTLEGKKGIPGLLVIGGIFGGLWALHHLFFKQPSSTAGYGKYMGKKQKKLLSSIPPELRPLAKLFVGAKNVTEASTRLTSNHAPLIKRFFQSKWAKMKYPTLTGEANLADFINDIILFGREGT